MTDEKNLHVAERSLRIANKLNAMPDTSDFEACLEKAVAEVDAEGANAFTALVTNFIKSQEPKERVYKIKRSLKGARVKVAGFEGRSFSFGPVWENFVKAGKGPALSDQKKVRAHAAHVGVPNALKGKFADVLKALQAKLA
jgi:hypothetical protein